MTVLPAPFTGLTPSTPKRIHVREKEKGRRAEGLERGREKDWEVRVFTIARH